MKKIFALMICLCLIVGVFAGCNKNGVDDPMTTLPDSQTTTNPSDSQTTAPAQDDSKYDLANILGFDYSEYVTLGEYKNIEIRTDSKEYQAMRKQYIEYYLGQGGYVKEYENRAIKDGDTVNIDYVGYVDGVAFEGGDTKGKGANLTIGSHTYIDDFEEQLIGAKPGDTVNVNVTFPEDYGNTELKGKDALFVVKVNYIASAPIYPDLATNPTILKECFKYDSMDAFEAGIKDEIGQVVALDMVLNNMTIKSYPEKKLAEVKAQYEELYGSYAAMYGVSLEEFLKSQGINIDEISKEQLKNEMLYIAIAQAEGMSFTDEEYNQLCEDYAKENKYASLDALLESVASSYTSPAHAKYDLASYLVQEMARKVVLDTLTITLVK